MGLFGVLFLAGCTSAPQPAREGPQVKLTVSSPQQLAPLARVRIGSDQPLPAHLVRRLCPEFSLVTIARRSDWVEVHRRLNLTPVLSELDLNDGPVLGILAHVGENADRRWPLRLKSIGIVDGTGVLEATFRPGLYYPLQTADYLELAQARGLTSVGTVRINDRVFTIHAPRD